MSEELPNLEILIKLMKLSASSNDAEALLAVRKANEQLTKFGGDWERLLRGKVTVIGDPFLSMPVPAQNTGAGAPRPPRPQGTPMPSAPRHAQRPMPTRRKTFTATEDFA